LIVSWDEFPLAGTARVTFEAIYVGPDAVVNTASVEWSTLEIDPVLGASVQQSVYNPFSTERRYDPLDLTGVNNYVVSSSVRLSIPQRLPRTGFAPGKITAVPEQPADLAYTALGDLWLEIPDLDVQVDIVGVPFESRDWNLTWLAGNAGYLDGTAYPTHEGNSGITAHAYLADGTPGPFVNLDKLTYGDRVIVHLGGQQYIYEVREQRQMHPESVAAALRHEEYPWLTLITCKTYSETTDDYVYRTVVRAVLVDVVPE
jgi:LPXTG-site transpeptidase (sortase) family protein